MVAHRFRDLGHFTEYQQALRDWVKNLHQFGLEPVVSYNAEVYKPTIEEIK